MNISFQNKVAAGILVVTACLAAVWHYEVRVVAPRHNALITSLQNDLRQRDGLERAVQDFHNIRSSVDRVVAQGKVDDSVVASIRNAFTNIAQTDFQLALSAEDSIEELETDLNEFLKIASQLALYEDKIKQFIDGFAFYFQTFEKDLAGWKETTLETIATGGQVTNSLPFAVLSQKISVLATIIPEYDTFKQKLQSLEFGFNQWTADINAASTVNEKQALFGQKQYLLNGLFELFKTFNGYALKTLDRERENAGQIAKQINNSIGSVEIPFQEQFGVKNNAVQAQMAITQYKDQQYRLLKRAAIGIIFVGLLGLFFALAIYSFRFERGLALFKKQTFKAAEDSRALAASLNDNSTLVIKNFDLSRTLKEGLEETAGGFTQRQLNLQNIDQLVRDTDVLIKESHSNFLNIKEEFYNAEKTSQEIVHLTGALEGVAQQMTSIAERAPVTTDSQQQNAVDELKYLSGRIRFAVTATNTALEARKEKINETKARFDTVEKNMVQMTENTKDALRGLALARLDHSEEASRINEILENAKTTSRVIANEIEALNKQVSDFSVLSKHLDALHDLAVKASALNAQSLLVEEKNPVQISSSQRMNSYIQEYFKKVFENTSLPGSSATSKPADALPPNRISEASKDPSSHAHQTPADA